MWCLWDSALLHCIRSERPASPHFTRAAWVMSQTLLVKLDDPRINFKNKRIAQNQQSITESNPLFKYILFSFDFFCFVVCHLFLNPRIYSAPAVTLACYSIIKALVNKCTFSFRSSVVVVRWPFDWLSVILMLWLIIFLAVLSRQKMIPFFLPVTWLEYYDCNPMLYFISSPSLVLFLDWSGYCERQWCDI